VEGDPGICGDKECVLLVLAKPVAGNIMLFAVEAPFSFHSD
jgi:hypothetical protein